MKAQLLYSPAPIEEAPLHLAEVPLPEPGPGQVRLAVQACGICHTDLHIVEGDLSLPKLPLIPGHQVVGVVDALGPGVTRFSPGQQAGLPWLHYTCGACAACLAGKENLCEQARFTGYHVDGGYAEYVLAEQDFIYPIPAGFSAIQAAPLLCAGIIGYRALRLSEIGPGGTLGMYGFGASAHVAIQVARYWNCRVYVFTRSPEHRRLAMELGAPWTGQAQDTPPSLLDSAIIFAPAGSLVPEALRVLRKGGTLALAGITMSDIPAMPYALIYGERTVRSVANSTRQDAEELLHLATAIPIRTQVQTFPLDQANEALRLLKEGRIQGAGVLLL